MPYSVTTRSGAMPSDDGQPVDPTTNVRRSQPKPFVNPDPVRTTDLDRAGYDAFSISVRRRIVREQIDRALTKCPTDAVLLHLEAAVESMPAFE